MIFPYGAQYYRTPNPPESEWERDFKLMAEYNFNIVKIWAMWSWIHKAADEFDFEHFDKLFELAERYNIKVIVNTILENAPYWLIKAHPEALYQASDGQRFQPIARSNTPGGAWPGLCLDNQPVKGQAAKFLKALAKRYFEHPALYGYDVWNEVFFEPFGYLGNQYYCYCEASCAKFLEWLKEKYKSVEKLSDAWYRRYTNWDQVYPPRYLGGYPDWLDWIKFRVWNYKQQMRWRIQTLREVNKSHVIMSHGIAATVGGLPTLLTDDWDIAEEVDQWGLSSFPHWFGHHPSEHFERIDLVRSAANTYNRKIWQNELQGGQSGGGITRSPILRAPDTRAWNWTALMCGCKGLMYWQWRPELLGPESPGFGLCKLDGLPSERTEVAGWFAKFLNSNPELTKAQPIRGELAILILPESQIYCFIADGKTDYYVQAVKGIYRALWDANLQVDFTKIDGIKDYKLIYLPFPLMVESANAEKLKEYVKGGGILVSEACPALFVDHGYTSFKVPGLGLDELFGATEDETEFIPPDAKHPPQIAWEGITIPCAVYQEKLKSGDGQAIANYTDGAVAVVANKFGFGKTRLIGTYPGISYLKTFDRNLREFILNCVLEFGELEQHVKVNGLEVKARIHTGEQQKYLYVLNTCYEDRKVNLTIDPKFGIFKSAFELVAGKDYKITGNSLSLSLCARDGVVFKLK